MGFCFVKKVNFFHIILTLIWTLSLTKCGGDGCKYPDEIALGGLWEEIQSLTVRPLNTNVIAKESTHGAYTLKDGTTEIKAMSNLWQPLLMRNGEYAVVEGGQKMKITIDGSIVLAGYSQYLDATFHKWISTAGPTRYFKPIQDSDVVDEEIEDVVEDRVPTLKDTAREERHLYFRDNLSVNDGIMPIQWSDIKVKPGDQIPITVSGSSFGLYPALVKTKGCATGSNCYAGLSGGHGLMLYLYPNETASDEVKNGSLYSEPERWQCNMGLGGSYGFYMPYEYNPHNPPVGGFFKVIAGLIGKSVFDYTPFNPRDIDNPMKHDYASLAGTLLMQLAACIFMEIECHSCDPASPHYAACVAAFCNKCFVVFVFLEGLTYIMNKAFRDKTFWFCEDNYVQMWFSGYDFKNLKKVDKGTPEMHRYNISDLNFFLPDFNYMSESKLFNDTIDCAKDHIPNTIIKAGISGTDDTISKYDNNISLIQDGGVKKYQYLAVDGSTQTLEVNDFSIKKKIYPQASPKALKVHLPADDKIVEVTYLGNNLKRVTSDGKTYNYTFTIDGVSYSFDVNSENVLSASCYTLEEEMARENDSNAGLSYFTNVTADDCDDYCIADANGGTIFTRYGPFAGFHYDTSGTTLPAIFDSYGMCRGGYDVTDDGGVQFIYDQQDGHPSRSPLAPYWRIELSSPSAEKNSDEYGDDFKTLEPDERDPSQRFNSSCYIKSESVCSNNEVPSSMIVDLTKTLNWNSADGSYPQTVFLHRDSNSIVAKGNFEYTIMCTTSECSSKIGSGYIDLDENDPRIVDGGVLCGGLPNCGPTNDPTTIEMVVDNQPFTLVFFDPVSKNAQHITKRKNNYYFFEYGGKTYKIKQSAVSDHYKVCLEDTLRCSSWLGHYMNGQAYISHTYPSSKEDADFEDGFIGTLGRAPYVIACSHEGDDSQAFYNAGSSGVGDQYKYAYGPLHGEGKTLQDLNKAIGYDFKEQDFGAGKYKIQTAFVLKSNLEPYLKNKYFARCTTDWTTPEWMLLNDSGDISSINGETTAISGSFFRKPNEPTLTESDIKNKYEIDKVHARYGGMILNAIYNSDRCTDLDLDPSGYGRIKRCTIDSSYTPTIFYPKFKTKYNKQIILVKNLVNDPINTSEDVCTVTASGGGGGSYAIKMNEPFGDIISANVLSKFWLAKTFDWSITQLDSDDPESVPVTDYSFLDQGYTHDYVDSSGKTHTYDGDAKYINDNISSTDHSEHDKADVDQKEKWASDSELKDGKYYGVSRYETANGDVRYRNSVFKITEAARNMIGAGIVHAVWHPLSNGSNVTIFNKDTTVGLNVSGGEFNVMNGLMHYSRAYCYDESTFSSVMQNMIIALFAPLLAPLINVLNNEITYADKDYGEHGGIKAASYRDNYSRRACGTGIAFRVIPIPEFACIRGYDARCSNERINNTYATSSAIISNCVLENKMVQWTDESLAIGKCTKIGYSIKTRDATGEEIPQAYDSSRPPYRINTLVDRPNVAGTFSEKENVLESQCGICVRREKMEMYNGIAYTTDIIDMMPQSVRSDENCNTYENEEGERFIFATDVKQVTPLDNYSSSDYNDVVNNITNSFSTSIGYCASNYSNYTTYRFVPNTTTDDMKTRIKNAFNKMAIRNKASCVAIVEQIHSTFLAESVVDKSAPDAGSKTTVSGWTMEKENDERKQCREYIDAEIPNQAEKACDEILKIIETKDGENYYSYVFQKNAISAICLDNKQTDASSGGYHSVRDLTSNSLEENGYVELTNGEIHNADDAVTYTITIPSKIKGHTFINANLGFGFAGDNIGEGPMKLYKNFKLDKKEDLNRGYVITIGGTQPLTKGKYLYFYFQPLTSSGKPDPNYNPNTYYSTTSPNAFNRVFTPAEILDDKDIYHFKDYDTDDDGIATITAPSSGKVWFAILDIPEYDSSGLNKTPEKDGKAIVFDNEDAVYRVVNGDNYKNTNSGRYIVSGKIMTDDTDFVGGLLKSNYDSSSTFVSETLFNKLFIRPIKSIFFGWNKETKQYEWQDGFLYQLLKYIYTWPLLHIVYYIIVVFSVIMFGAKIMFGMEKTDAKSIMSKFLKYALIAGFINPSWMELYTRWFVKGAFDIADGLSAYVAGNFTGSTYTESDAENFVKIAFGPVDTIFRFWFKIETIERFLAILFSSWVGWISALLLLLCMVHFVISVLEVLLIYIAIMFRMFIHLIIGPFFFIFLAFQSTEKRWTKWWQELAGMISEQVCIFTALSVFCTIYYHILKGAMGFAYCWEPVLTIPVINMTLLSMWKIAGQLPTHMAELMGDYGPQGSGYTSNQGFSILTGLCLFLITAVMSKFVDKASKFGASIFGGISSGEAFGIQQLAQMARKGVNNLTVTGTKTIASAPLKKITGGSKK